MSISCLLYRLGELLNRNDKQFSEDLEHIEAISHQIASTQQQLNNLHSEVQDIHAFDPQLTEETLTNLEQRITACVKDCSKLIEDSKKVYLAKQNIVPSDLAKEFSNLDSLAERVRSQMEGRSKEFKRARTVRSEYLNGVDAIRSWLQSAEVQVLDHTTAPEVAKDLLQRISQELTGIYERFNLVKSNGQVCMDNCRPNRKGDSDEKLLIKSTIDQLTQQLGQMRAWIDERKQQVGDCLDTWARFMNLYNLVMAWVAEKRQFIDQSIILRTLPEARSKANEYMAAERSIKAIDKHLSDMDREVERISQMTTVTELKEKLQQAEEAKTAVEALLLERVRIIYE